MESRCLGRSLGIVGVFHRLSRRLELTQAEAHHSAASQHIRRTSLEHMCLKLKNLGSVVTIRLRLWKQQCPLGDRGGQKGCWGDPRDAPQAPSGSTCGR